MLKILMRTSVLVAASLAMATAAIATETHPCAVVVDPAKRLACYDTAFPPTSGAESLESRRERELKDFGLNQIQRRAGMPESQRVEIPDRIEAAVTAVRTLAEGERMVTLDNGQLWMLTEVTSQGFLKAGDRVVVRKAAVGTFMLVTPGRVALRAKRVQ